ncbi:unnamed protein product [Phytophthora lilii]|uniref:Unnamed protein product n=1 Tax=Phytophthora lilii TaxID=2077276 RepID=A0A9W6X1Q5_9STRA|nr:unnamed protein product [Phytophthora lilii]
MREEDMLRRFLSDMEALDRLEEDKKPDPSWIKRKKELQSLRQQAEALETRLQFWQTKNRESSVETQTQRSVRTAALVEKHRRQVAQMENERLRNRLQACGKRYEALQSVLETATFEFLGGRKAVRMEMNATQRMQFRNAQVFAVLEERMDARFRALDRSSWGSRAAANLEQVETCYRADDQSVKALELSRVQLLPFDTEAINAAIWPIIEHGNFPDGQDARLAKRAEDVYVMEGSLSVPLDSGGTISVKTYSVIKRFLTPSGVLVLAEASKDWAADLPGTGPWSHATQECGTFVVSKYAVEGDPFPKICQVRSSISLRPTGTCVRDNCPPFVKPEAFDDVVIPFYRGLVNSRYQFIENALFDTIRSRALHHGEVGTAVTRTWLASMLSHVVKSPLDVEPPRFQRSTRNAVYLPQAPDFQGTYRRKCWLASSIGGVNIVVLYRLGPSLSFELEVKTAFRLAIIRYWEVMTSPAATMLDDVRVLDMFLRDMNELDSVLAGTTRNPKQKQLDVTGPSVAPSRSVDVASER